MSDDASPQGRHRISPTSDRWVIEIAFITSELARSPFKAIHG